MFEYIIKVELLCKDIDCKTVGAGSFLRYEKCSIIKNKNPIDDLQSDFICNGL